VTVRLEFSPDRERQQVVLAAMDVRGLVTIDPVTHEIEVTEEGKRFCDELRELNSDRVGELDEVEDPVLLSRVIWQSAVDEFGLDLAVEALLATTNESGWENWMRRSAERLNTSSVRPVRAV
jgi:hypothetical protein